ncbi:MAG: sterol desaturase/sphingolipid hydroxylase (fatty acid hydroxylase superfamily) [Chitinophagales bacterium]|jgi:sterol desaturase/sphingolipid hydroxylase (fatty acid hydroxylase superfamily)
MEFGLDNKILAISIVVFFILISIEAFIDYKQKKHIYAKQDFFASISMGFGSLFVGGAMKFLALLVYTFLYQFRLFDLGSEWWVWVLIFFADDFTFYWHHRLSHEVRVLWAAHVNHHSSVRMNLGTALRQSWAEQLYKYVWWLWLPLIGFAPIMIIVMQTISLVYQFFQHTELIRKLPKPIEWIFNTPSHHRVHHGSNIKYLDQNHAGILIIWDRLFNTFQEEEEQVKYGITVNIDSYNPFKIASHEYISLFKDVNRAKGLGDKLKYLFMPPGWSHDGEDQRARTLRKNIVNNANN